MRQTSIDAYKSVVDFLGEKQRVVYEALLVAPMTNCELAEFLHWPINCITPRVGELVHFKNKHGQDQPLVKYGGVKIHAGTHRRQIVWKCIDIKESRQLTFI